MRRRSILGAAGLWAALAFARTPEVEGLVLPHRKAELCAAVAGRILDMKAAEGQAVKEGQVLAALDGRLEELEMQRAKVLLERREFEAKGARRLYDNKIIPEAKALESRIDLDLARLQYETATQQVKLRSVVAPFDGVVALRTHEPGESVAPGMPLFRLLDLSRVWVVCNLDPALLEAFPLGRRVQVVVGTEPPAAGEVAFVAPEAEAPGLVRLKVVVDRPGPALRPGLKVRVHPVPGG